MAVPATQAAEELIALNLPENAPLKVLVDYVSQRLGINILYDDAVINQKITIKSPSKIPKESLLGLLESVLKMKGLIIVDADTPGWKRIVTATNLNAVAQAAATQPQTDQSRPAVLTQIFALKYSDTQHIEPILKPFLSQPGGNSIPVNEQQLLIVTDLYSNMVRIGELIHRLDQPRPQVTVEFVPARNLEASALAAQVVQILASKQKSQGVAGGGAGGGGVGGEALEISADTRTNRLVMIGRAEQVAEARKLLESLDVPLELQTRLYPFQSASPARLDRIMKELIGPLAAKTQYQSVVDTEARLLIVTATEDIHRKITQLKKDLDQPITKEQSPIRFYKLANTTAADVLETIRNIEGVEGVANSGPKSPTPSPPPQSPLSPDNRLSNITSGASAIPYRPEEKKESGAELHPASSIKTAKATITADPNTNSIIVVADPSEQQVYAELIKTLDRLRPQVLVECVIVTIDTTRNFSLGVEISGSGSLAQNEDRYITFSSFGLSTVNPKTGRLALIPGTGFNGALISSDIADVVVRALSTSTRARVMSAPKILVNDNATGTLASIAEAPFTSVNASSTVATTSFAGYTSAGTTITLTPHISTDGDHLQLDYSVVLNNFSGQPSGGIPPPRQTNTVTSKVTIPDGQTIVIGGLNRQDNNETFTSIPILDQIPLIKNLFGSETKNESQSTLFVFVRPIVLRDDRFEDLKFLSEKDARLAGLASDLPTSEPLTMN